MSISEADYLRRFVDATIGAVILLVVFEVGVGRSVGWR